jgi:hypothetical protein
MADLIMEAEPFSEAACFNKRKKNVEMENIQKKVSIR